MKKIFLFLSCISILQLSAQQNTYESMYSIGNWDADSLGNHRVVVNVNKKADAVLANIKWRRRDSNPHKKGLIIIDAKTGNAINNIKIYKIDNEEGIFAFQPQTIPGDYYIYYLKNIVSGRKNYPTVSYPSINYSTDKSWLNKNKLNKNILPKLDYAEVKRFESINQFNSFYPMEIIATKDEEKSIINKAKLLNTANPDLSYIIFGEDRKNPIRMSKYLPYKWFKDDNINKFKGKADKGEYYTFQLGLWAFDKEIQDVNIRFNDLYNKKNNTIIHSSKITCFNTGGINTKGMSFIKHINVPKRNIQPLWIGIDIPRNIQSGIYEGNIQVSSKNAETKIILVKITISDSTIKNHGDNETWRHSRLRWLNSKIGNNDEIIAPYTPLLLKNMTINCLGREIELTKDGFIKQISSYFDPSITKIGTEKRNILAEPLKIKTNSKWENIYFSFTEKKLSSISWRAINKNSDFIMTLDGKMEFDGNVEYKVILMPLSKIHVNNISLETKLNAGIDKYMMGLGKKGRYCPDSLNWKWDVKKNQDACWIGDVNAGIQIRLYDNNYIRPLNTNFYHKHPLIMPSSWANNGKGGIKLNKTDSGTNWIAYSGERVCNKGKSLHYYFNILITPFHKLNTNKQWKQRYYHKYDFIDEIDKYGANVINIHHANSINPYINYPFLRTNLLKSYIDGAHAINKKVKIYNTVRELSNHCSELFALRSLNDEIFSKGEGGGYSWLQEHLEQNYIAAWFVPHLKDAAIVNTGVSRWHNYYLEGLNWLCKNIGIDGLYIDDLAFDRETMKRVRRILNKNNPETLIDLHSANQYNVRDGFANSANLYLEHFPYLDRLWFGEYFDYNMPPEFWLVEISGIPFGLMGEMLWEGGNPWRGMLYGITARSPWSGDNRPLWKLWDLFGMQNSDMIGYWVEDNPIKTNEKLIPATVYVHKGIKTLISLASWKDTDSSVKLQIDWEKLGLNPNKVTLKAPDIKNFQSKQQWGINDKIVVPKGKGLLIIIENNH